MYNMHCIVHLSLMTKIHWNTPKVQMILQNVLIAWGAKDLCTSQKWGKPTMGLFSPGAVCVEIPVTIVTGNCILLVMKYVFNAGKYTFNCKTIITVNCTVSQQPSENLIPDSKYSNHFTQMTFKCHKRAWHIYIYNLYTTVRKYKHQECSVRRRCSVHRKRWIRGNTS